MPGAVRTPRLSRLARLADELVESGLRESDDPSVFDVLVEEADHALRPPVHERRVPSGEGKIMGRSPCADPAAET
jgi:hypothetical protein